MSKLLKKALIAAVILFAIIAVLTSLFSVWNLNTYLVAEYKNKGMALTQSIARSSSHLIFNSPYETIQASIDDYLAINGIAYVFVEDDQGEIISHTFVPTIPEIFANHNLSTVNLLAEELTETPLIQNLDIAGLGRVIDIQSSILAGVSGQVHVGLSWQLIEHQILIATLKQVAVIALLFIGISLITYVLVGSISEDLNLLIQGVKMVQKGEYEVNISVRDRNEIGMLALAFNRMVTTVSDYAKSLQNSLKQLSDIKYALDQSSIVSIADLTGMITYVNDKFCEISGYSQEELLGNTYHLVNSNYHGVKFYHDLWETITSGDIWRGEIKNKTKTGTYYWVDTTIVPFLDELDEVFQYLAIQTEITDRKDLQEKLEAKVKERTKQLGLANEEISLLNEQLKAENIRIGAELDVARQIQQLILPKPEELAAIQGLEIAGFMEPAAEVGGDYYDVLYTDDMVTIGIGDVTGHGLESGLLMVMTQTAVRTLKELQKIDAVTFLATLNRVIYKNLKRMNSDKNLTLCILNYSQGIISLSGQHEEAIVVRASGEIELIDTIDLGLPIGLDQDITNFIAQVTIELNSGDGVVLYTDGITEARDINKTHYGLDRLCDIIQQNWRFSAQEIQQKVIKDVHNHIGEQRVFDDLTLLIIKRQ
ncbi:SpoIIE family protein phosphatase [Crocosphaera sp. XPORK-15E]|uniref:SpoIIE family protein phosphatase n=1 Tax=Crocosphaera sp. XPORK-15E TaxID=3110247 RepID=UPI002B21D52E|nr:SpoIIE family protein phosphatase [Crocosphaera sp. XPORK-15E]MEA5533980.1 SpoIIE family protein phosphatase [Crocosphaera sp. XPORK-15E]